MKWVAIFCFTAILFAQEKGTEAKNADPLKDAISALQKVSAELKETDSQMKEAALQAQQLTIKVYQKANELENKLKTARSLCKGTLVQEDLVWVCTK